MQAGSHTIALKFLILQTDQILPPLVSFAELPKFIFNSETLLFDFGNSRKLKARIDSRTKLIIGDVQLPWKIDKMPSVFLSVNQEPLLQELHAAANHVPARKVRRLLPNNIQRQVQLKRIIEVLQKCQTCNQYKDKHGRPHAVEKKDKEHDMAGIDLVEFSSPSGGYKYAVVTRHRITGVYGMRMLPSKSEAELLPALKSMFGEDVPLPTIVRVDGAKEFSIAVRGLLTDMGVTQIQTSPAYQHTANGYAENTIKHFVEALRCCMADDGEGCVSKWSSYAPKAISRLNNMPDANGRTPIQKAFGINGLSFLLNRIKASFGSRVKQPFDVGADVWWTPPNRKERPGFDKLAKVSFAAKVTQVVDTEVRRIITEEGKNTTALIRELKYRFPSPSAPDSTASVSTQHDSSDNPASTEKITKNDQTPAKTAQVVSVKNDERALKEGEIRYFKRDEHMFMGEITKVADQSVSLHVMAISTPEGKINNEWTKCWIESNKESSWLRLGKSHPKPQRDCTVSPIIHDTHVSNIGNIVQFEENSKRITNPSVKDGRKFFAYMSSIVCYMVSDTTHQKMRYSKMSDVEKIQADAAFADEMNKYKKYKVYTPICIQDLPDDARVVRPVVIFTSKKQQDGSRKMKCRMTADGSSISMEDTTTRNANMEEVRILYLLASTQEKFKGDVKTADAEQGYMQFPAKQTDVYMLPPTLHEDSRSDVIWKINANLYGLPDGGAVFEENVRRILKQLGWKQLEGMLHSWVKLSNDGEVEGYLSAYVDDFKCLGVGKTANDLLREIGTCLKINIQEGDVRFVGNDFTFNKNGSHYSQNEYAASISNQTTNSFRTPLPVRENERRDDSRPLTPKQLPAARGLLGKLLFMARDSRPDIAYPVSFVGRGISKATQRTVELLERIAAYAKATPLHIAIPSSFVSKHIKLDAFVDASLGSDGEVHGQTGWVILANGYPVMWRSKRQQRVARSSAKSELIALHDVADALEWLRVTLQRAGALSSATIFTDAQDVVALVNNKESRPRERADMFRLQQVRQLLGRVHTSSLASTIENMTKELGKTELVHIPGVKNPADCLTKAASGESFSQLYEQLQQRLPRKSAAMTVLMCLAPRQLPSYGRPLALPRGALRQAYHA